MRTLKKYFRRIERRLTRAARFARAVDELRRRERALSLSHRWNMAEADLAAWCAEARRLGRAYDLLRPLGRRWGLCK